MAKRSLLSPFQKFVKIESLSGLLLILATITALIWANSPFADSYNDLWQFEVGITSQDFGLSKPLLLWINDGLMAIFFFLIGLEIKRELLIGELNSVRKATLPIFAAIGGMIIPLLVYLILNQDAQTTNGWGIPMATDIAFSLAILKALGKSAPLSLKVFLTAFAIVDDLGAVLIIAIFYSGGVKWMLVFIALALLAILFLLMWQGWHSRYLTFIIGIVIWILFLKSGIHPTIAGVLVALTIPIRQRIDTNAFLAEISAVEDRLEATPRSEDNILTKEQIEEIDNLKTLIDDYQSPLQQLEHKIHSCVAYFIIPIFALANAGVSLGTDLQINWQLALVIAAALFVGKGVGVSVLSWIALRLKVADLPDGSNFVQIIGVAILSGVGFTMSIFIASLAFAGEGTLIDSSKIGILIGSIISAIVGAMVIKLSAKKV